MRCRAVLLFLLCLGCQQPAADQPASPETWQTVDGETCQLPAPGTAAATVLLFVSADCPISNGYAPEIRRLWQDYQGRGVRFQIVYADAMLPRATAHQHAEEFNLPVVPIHDPALSLARRFGATVVPEAVVLDGATQLVYRGRIDDRYADYGKLRPHVTRTEVRDALDALLAGRPVPAAHVPALGCPIHFEPVPASR